MGTLFTTSRMTTCRRHVRESRGWTSGTARIGSHSVAGPQPRASLPRKWSFARPFSGSSEGIARIFLTPVIWDVNMLPVSKVIAGVEVPVQRLTYILNPMASIVATYRDLLYHGRSIGPDFFLRTAVTAVIMLLLGFAVFHHLSGRFAEEV